METLAQYVARNRNLRREFSQLHREWLEQKELPMKETNDRTLNQGSQPERKPAVTAQPGSASTSPMSVNSQVTVGAFKPVDRKTLEGSTPGDFRAPANTADLTDFAKNPPCPREPVRQSQLVSSKLQAMDAPVPVPVTGESEASHN